MAKSSKNADLVRQQAQNIANAFKSAVGSVPERVSNTFPKATKVKVKSSGGPKAPTTFSSTQLNGNNTIPRLTTRGQSLVRLNKPTRFESQDRTRKRFKAYQFNPYDEINKTKETWEHLNDKEYNSTPERQAYLKVLQNYQTSGTVVEYATKNLQHDEAWFTYTDHFGDAVLGRPSAEENTPLHGVNYLNDYLGVGVKIRSQEEYDMYLNRFEQVQKWFDSYTVSKKVYDPEKETGNGRFEPFTAIDSIDPNAPLPPWVEATSENQERWTTYLHRSDEEINVVNQQGASYHEMLVEQAGKESQKKLDQAELERRGISGKIGSAASELGQEGVVNSFADAISATLGKDSTDSTHYFRDYIRDYWINPIRTGHYGRFLANRLFDAMDLLDMPAKGVRATLASTPYVLYGTDQTFDNQEMFVYSGGKEKQKQIMEAGGKELLNNLTNASHGYDPNSTPSTDAKERLEKAGLWEDYQTLMNEYRNYTPEKSALDNLIAAYTTPGLDFYTNTGNMGKDLAIDVMLDPTLIIGGGARSVAGGAAKNIARSSVERGLNKVFNVAEGGYSQLDKDTKRLVEGFIRKMDSKTVIFKNRDNIDKEVDNLALRLRASKRYPESDSDEMILNNKQEADDFKNLVKSSIYDHIHTTNSAIVANSRKGVNNAQEAFLKTVYNIGYYADELDSTLLKMAFPEPFLMKDTIKGSKWASDNTTVGKYISTLYHRRRQKKLDDARRLFGEEYNGVQNLDLEQLQHFKDLESGMVEPDTSTQFKVMGATSAKLRSMTNNCNMVLNRLKRGTISEGEALFTIRNELQTFAGKEPCNSLEQLDTIIENRFSGFFDSTYTKYKEAFQNVQNYTAIKRSNSEDSFFRELREAQEAEDVSKLLNKYRNHLDYNDSAFLNRLVLKCNNIDIDSRGLYRAITEAQERSRVFNTNSDNISKSNIIEKVKKSSETAHLDIADSLEGVQTITVGSFKKIIDNTPEYAALAERLNKNKLKGFNRLSEIFQHSDDYVYTVEELIDELNHTFFDVIRSFDKKLLEGAEDIPDVINDALKSMHNLRLALEQSVAVPVSNSMGTVYRFQLDRMTVFDRLINDERVLKFFDKFNTHIRSVLNETSDSTLSSIDSKHLGFFQALNNINRKIEATELFFTLDTELGNVLNDYQRYAIEDYLFGLSSQKNDDLLNQLTRNHSTLSYGLDTAIYSSYSDSKIGIRNARARMSNFNSSIWGKYGAELRAPENEDLRRWVRDMVSTSAADPISYVNLQILQNILLDDNAISYYNKINKHNPVVFMHCSTSGLNPVNSEITGIGYKTWTELPENASLRDIFENIINRDNESIRVAKEHTLDDEFLNHVFDSSTDLRYHTIDDKVEAYNRLFGVRGDHEINEADVIQEFCKEINELSFVNQGTKKVKGGTPCLVVHDFEGFNMPFFKNKVIEYSELNHVQDVYNYLGVYDSVSENSFDILKNKVNEQILTKEQKDEVISILYKTVQDMNELGNTFRFLDLQDISSQIEIIAKYIDKGLLNDTNDPVLKRLVNEYSNILGLLDDVHAACREMKEFSMIAENHVLYRNGIDGFDLSTETNPIRNIRGEDTLQFMLNMRSKYDLLNIQSYFNLNYDETLRLNNIRLSTLEKMSGLSDYVIQSKRSITKTAEQFLTPYKASFDVLIEDLKVFAVSNAVRVNQQTLNSLEYVAMLKTPNSAIESYLICQKLYDDIIKYYDKDVIKYFTRNTFKDDRFKTLLEMRFVDGYSNPLKHDDINIVFEAVRDILRGKRNADIWLGSKANLVEGFPVSSSSRLFEKVDKAQAIKSVFNNVRFKLRNVTNLDDLFHVEGIKTKSDFKEGMLYQHVSEFMTSIESKFTSETFLDTIDFIQNWRKNYMQYYNLRKLMTDGEFDKQKLINELLWNDYEMHVIYPNRFTAELEDAYKKFINELDIPFIDVSYENGIVAVYIKEGFHIQENLSEGYRYVVGYEKIHAIRNEYERIPFPDYEELKNPSEFLKYKNDSTTELVDAAITEREYELLKDIYNDIDYFSDGRSIGTLGNMISSTRLEDFFKKIPNTYEKMNKNSALRLNDMRKSLICDPGFIDSKPDMFNDILCTFENLERTTNDVRLTASFIFGNHSDVRMKDILSEVSNREALEYLQQVDDYVIVDIKAGDTHSGMFLEELKPQTEQDIERLRNSNAAIIPYELYVELQSRMNYKDANSVMGVFNKALVAFKAVQLCKPGAWVRNYIDAITKAILYENEGGIPGAMAMASRSCKSIREIPAVLRMQQKEMSYISEAHWPELCRRYHLPDMTWEDYQLLSGLLDRDNIVNTPVHATHYREGVVSGKSVNFVALKDEDIKIVWNKLNLSKDPIATGMDLDLFNKIRRGVVKPNPALEKQYDDVYHKILTGFADRDTPLFDKAIDKIFVPFNLSEQAARYAQLLWLRDLGYSNNQAVKRVVDTQFRTLPNAHLLNKMEMIVPFATFKFNNALFWIKMIDKNPSYFRLFEHMYGEIAYTDYEEAIQEHNEYDVEQDYMLKTGGIPIGGSGLYFKLDPSCMDVFRIFYGGPPQIIKGLNPLLQYGFKYSMYELGYNSKEFLRDLDYKYDMKSFIADTVNLMPGLNRIYDFYNMRHDKAFLYQNAPTFVSRLLVKWFPSMFGAKLDFKSRAGDDFKEYQRRLAEDGLWFDCNLGKTVPLEDYNELGANDPRINWDDVQYYMMIRFGKVWDSNVGKFVPLAELSEGGLNQEFDFENDPEAWDKLCAEYKKVGKVFDYNIRHFVRKEELSSGGLNDPNISFKERTRLYKEKFGYLWDANQSKFVDEDHYIPGGLNSLNGINNLGDWNKIKAYRRALFGEEYVYDPVSGKKKFVQMHEPTHVTLESLLLKSNLDDDYYQYVALPRINGVALRNCTVKDGVIKTGDGKIVLTWNEDYNNRVLGQLDTGMNWGRRNWRRFQHYTGRRFYNHNDYQGVYTEKNDYEDFYKYNFQYNGQAYRADKPHRIHKSTYGRVIPYGGPYTKFSFYTR